MAKKAAAKTEAKPEKVATVADLSSQLNSLLNSEKKQEACAGEVEAPVKKTTSRSNFKGELVIPNPSGGVLSIVPIKTFVAVDTDKIERHMFHGEHPVLEDVLVDGKPTGEKRPVFEDVLDEKGKKTGEKRQKMATCLGSLKQGSLFCADCGTPVSKSEANYGVNVGSQIVFITDDEMKAQQSMRDGKMRILEYIDESEINPIFYEDAEFVAPDGTAPVLTAFAMLVEGLKRTGKVAKGVRVKSGREQYFTLRPYGQFGLTMHYLRADYEVRSCDKWSPITVDEKLVQVMASLIEATAVPFTPAPQDRYLTNVRRLIKQKAAGVKVDVPKADTEEQAAVDLVAALEQALNFAKTKKAAAGK
jgi:DNA end-binding protein Ku